jgi:hypothetical protein
MYVGRSYIELGDKEKAKENLEVAKSLSIARHGNVMEKSIVKDLEKLQ